MKYIKKRLYFDSLHRSKGRTVKKQLNRKSYDIYNNVTLSSVHEMHKNLTESRKVFTNNTLKIKFNI